MLRRITASIRGSSSEHCMFAEYTTKRANEIVRLGRQEAEQLMPFLDGIRFVPRVQCRTAGERPPPI
jgi:hypothetical protein